MAALHKEFSLFGVHVTFGKPATRVDSKRARQFANRVYNETKGATPELRRLYAKLRENEQRNSG